MNSERKKRWKLFMYIEINWLEIFWPLDYRNRGKKVEFEEMMNVLYSVKYLLLVVYKVHDNQSLSYQFLFSISKKQSRTKQFGRAKRKKRLCQLAFKIDSIYKATIEGFLTWNASICHNLFNETLQNQVNEQKFTS